MKHSLSSFPRYLLAPIAGVCLVLAAPAQAAPLTVLDTLRDYNLVVFENLDSTSHVDGRTYAGGNVSGGDYAQRLGASDKAGLIVGGDARGVNVNGGGVWVGGSLASANVNRGTASVGGDASSVNFNGGSAYVGGVASGSNFNGGRNASAPASPGTADLESQLRALSWQLAGLADTHGTVSVLDNRRATFTANAGSDGIAVFDLTGTALLSYSEFAFDFGDASLVVFNVDALSAEIAANFLGGSAQGLGARMIWNFHSATDLILDSQFGGTVLAPNATLTNYNNIEGTAVARSMVQRGEVHLLPLAPGIDLPEQPAEVPVPGVLWLLAAALAGMGWMRRGARPSIQASCSA